MDLPWVHVIRGLNGIYATMVQVAVRWTVHRLVERPIALD